jgi:hypothetical protein
VKRILILAAVAANFAMGLQLYQRWADPQRVQWKEPEPIKPVLAELSAPKAAQIEDLGKYRETVERPLFSPTRRPVIKKVTEAEKPKVDALKDVKVTGLYGAAERGGALLSISGKLQRLAYGGKIAEWKLIGEKDRKAEFVSDDGERRLLKLESVALPAAATTPPSTAAKAPQPGGASGAPGLSRGQSLGITPVAPKSEEQRKQEIKEMAQRINAVRAARGMPPIKEE